jgi:hypothetical protein
MIGQHMDKFDHARAKLQPSEFMRQAEVGRRAVERYGLDFRRMPNDEAARLYWMEKHHTLPTPKQVKHTIKALGQDGLNEVRSGLGNTYTGLKGDKGDAYANQYLTYLLNDGNWQPPERHVILPE